MTDSVAVLAILAFIVAASEWLAARTFVRHVGSALMVIVLGAIAANSGLLPSGSSTEAPVAVYDVVFGYVAPLSIFWLLLPARLNDILRVGRPMLFAFLAGAIGTTVGVIGAMALVGGEDAFGPLYRPLGGMFVGTFTGGSVNFNAVALAYDVVREGTLYAGSVAVDNVITAVWMIATLSIPRLLGAGIARERAPKPATDLPEALSDIESVGPFDLSLTLVAGLGALWLSNQAVALLSRVGVQVPLLLVLTTVALILAQVPGIGRLKGPRVLAMFSVYLFLTVIGAFCDFGALASLGRLGLYLLVFALLVVLVHGTVVFGAGRLLRIDPVVSSVASQANVGGSTSALALARSLERGDLVLPAILLGTLGNAVGTYLGFLAAAYLIL